MGSNPGAITIAAMTMWSAPVIVELAAQSRVDAVFFNHDDDAGKENAVVRLVRDASRALHHGRADHQEQHGEGGEHQDAHGVRSLLAGGYRRSINRIPEV